MLGNLEAGWDITKGDWVISDYQFFFEKMVE